MPRLSTRISLRWLPGEAFENTDTAVLSVKDWYVDLRVDVSSLVPHMDWAIAGERVVESVEPSMDILQYAMNVLLTRKLNQAE